MGEKELEELFWRSTDGPSEGGQAASATEKATVQVRWGYMSGMYMHLASATSIRNAISLENDHLVPSCRDGCCSAWEQQQFWGRWHLCR